MTKPEISPNRQRGIDKGCPACIAGRYHSDEEWDYHPDADKGIEPGVAGS